MGLMFCSLRRLLTHDNSFLFCGSLLIVRSARWKIEWVKSRKSGESKAERQLPIRICIVEMWVLEIDTKNSTVKEMMVRADAWSDCMPPFLKADAFRTRSNYHSTSHHVHKKQVIVKDQREGKKDLPEAKETCFLRRFDAHWLEDDWRTRAKIKLQGSSRTRWECERKSDRRNEDETYEVFRRLHFRTKHGRASFHHPPQIQELDKLKRLHRVHGRDSLLWYWPWALFSHVCARVEVDNQLTMLLVFLCR